MDLDYRSYKRSESGPPLCWPLRDEMSGTGRREGMIMRVRRREVSCERGWGVSLRSTTCKGMLIVPGGELRCTGNLCSERHSRTEVGERLLTIKRLQNIVELFSRKQTKKKSNAGIAEFFQHTADVIFLSSSVQLASSIYDSFSKRTVYLLRSLDRGPRDDT